MINWDNLAFRFAKTMPEIPHWYIVRKPEIESDFAALAELIQRDGQDETWQDMRTYRYWYRGDGYKYWHMGNIINRAKVETIPVIDMMAANMGGAWLKGKK